MLDGEGSAILNEFGKNRTLPPDSVEVQGLVKKWQAYITDNYFNCTKEILSCLDQMYVGDERFTQHIDQYGVGTAAFMAAAIEAYTNSFYNSFGCQLKNYKVGNYKMAEPCRHVSDTGSCKFFSKISCSFFICEIFTLRIIILYFLIH